MDSTAISNLQSLNTTASTYSQPTAGGGMQVEVETPVTSFELCISKSADKGDKK